MRMIRFGELVEGVWKNGGGITREIAARHDGGHLVWRLSMADVTRDGAFSDFSGLMRILTVIEGGAMELMTPDGVLMAHPRVPLRFDGGLKVEARLTAGALRDLNLMFDPQRVEGEVTVVAGPCDQEVAAGCGETVAVHALTGDVRLGQHMLARGDSALLEAESLPFKLVEGGSGLLIRLAAG